MPAPKPERDAKIKELWDRGLCAKDIRAELSLTSAWVVYEVSRKENNKIRQEMK